MVGRNPARFVAPIALVATVVGVTLIVTAHVGRHSGTRNGPHVLARTASKSKQYARATFYTVKPGDNLTRIASKTGVRLTTLEQLNPSLHPNTLASGQRIRLRR
jgi:LysM repeat protein